MVDTSVSDSLVETQGPKIAGLPGGGSASLRWLVLTHHLPANPAYLRVKVSRRLERIGAVALKNSVYVLPANDDTLEDFQWLCGEIETDGGETSLSVAHFVDVGTDTRLVRSFQEARGVEYARILEAARAMRDEMESGLDVPEVDRAATRVNQLRRQLTAVRSVDFFDAPAGAAAAAAVDGLESVLRGEGKSREEEPMSPGVGSGRTWVTREGVKVDRIASAWLIRRFIDPEARFKFVPASGYAPAEGELRFDMFEGEYTHVGDSCTMETLLRRFDIEDPALTAVSEVVHDIDIKDDRFGRPEVAGVASLIRGIGASTFEDTERLERGFDLFDGLYESFRTTI